jgi:hypothetical protein
MLDGMEILNQYRKYHLFESIVGRVVALRLA